MYNKNIIQILDGFWLFAILKLIEYGVKMYDWNLLHFWSVCGYFQTWIWYMIVCKCKIKIYCELAVYNAQINRWFHLHYIVGKSVVCTIQWLKKQILRNSACNIVAYRKLHPTRDRDDLCYIQSQNPTGNRTRAPKDRAMPAQIRIYIYIYIYIYI